MKINSHELARAIRSESLKMVSRAKASHIGGALSMSDLLGVLYAETLAIRPEDPKWDGRDRLILSKGHSCVALYSALA
jgi:transketolase